MASGSSGYLAYLNPTVIKIEAYALQHRLGAEAGTVNARTEDHIEMDSDSTQHKHGNGWKVAQNKILPEEDLGVRVTLVK
jgi:hypothetical protein